MIKAIFVTGPTCGGKSKLAISLAKKFKGEIINADSRQVYKYLDIGSGKFDLSNLKNNKKIKVRKKNSTIIINNIVHHLLSIAHPLKNYSLSRWLKDVDRTIKKINKKNKLPIFCGGTILYLKAIKEGWILPEVKPNYKLRKELEKQSNEILFQKLYKLDPQRAKNVDPQNKRRIIRALEIINLLGKVPKITKKPKYEILIISPKVDIKKLEKKIKFRLKRRSLNIIKEIKKIRNIGISLKRIINFGLEYRWYGKYLNKEIDLKTAEENCYLNIVRFAKKQIRELKKIKEVKWVNNQNEAFEIVKKFL